MRAVVQRVTRASVAVNDQIISEIGRGYLVLLGVEAGDTDTDLQYIVDKVANLRVFEDAQGKMNLSLQDTSGQILVVSQFTLLGDARHGRRPGFSTAEQPERADAMYLEATNRWRGMGIPVETGVFRADMAVSLVNDGPVTILLDSKKTF
ncbi:MAG TPA: D-aminoacyl-tRNA deacylase [Candidatus Limiplasma sp.]|nr:D-aminoacyl-tRNA deacylase [Candidatus Limiplasma sp.]HRX08771.1 D-aminoacyl-tRNA deacylase [Candidatus Limiplasma sp.]